MKLKFNYYMPTRIIFGAGELLISLLLHHINQVRKPLWLLVLEIQ